MKTPSASAPSFLSAALPLAISAFLGAAGALAAERVLLSHAPVKPTLHAKAGEVVPRGGTAPAPAVPARAARESEGAPLDQKGAEAAFRALPDAESRASGVERALRESIQPLVPGGSKLHDIRCRGSECRFSVLHAAPSGHSALMAAVGEKPPAGFASLRWYESTGKEATETVAFLTQEAENRESAQTALESASTAFDVQNRDDAWATRTARDVENGIRGALGNGSTLEGVECRADGCRITVAHSSEAGREKFMNAYSNAPPAGLASSRIFATSDHGIPKTIVFSSRTPAPATDEG